MKEYDNYSPEIPYSEELPPVEVISPGRPASSEKEKRKSSKKQTKRSAPKETVKPAKQESEPFFKRVRDWAESPTTRMLTGIFVGGLGIYLLVAFISYLTDCFTDQSIIHNSPVGQAPGVSNKAGEGGARLSEFLINECFGLGSFVIIGWLIAMSLKLLVGRPHFKSVNFTIKCFVALITVSLIVGLLTIGLNSTVNWGGYHGRYVNLFVKDFLGWWGATILCIMLIATFVVICLRDLINWINRLRAKHAAHRRMVAEEKARRLEEQRVIEEMRRVEEQDDLQSGYAPEAAEESETEDNTVSFNPDDNRGLYSEIGDIDEYVTDDHELMTTDRRSEYESTDDNTDHSESDPSNCYAISSGEPEEETDESADSADVAGDENSVDSESENPAEEITDEDATDEDGTGKMVVNVNHIAAADSPADDNDNTHMSEHYKFPPLEILREGLGQVAVNPTEQIENKERIRKTLADFGIPIVSIEATVGPTVTLYEIRPDKGQKVAKIKSLVDDISLSLSAIGVRIIAPIPGKGTVGIEVANKNPQMVSMRTVIGSQAYRDSRYKLPVALGSTINNEVYIADLTKMPHMLVAGATGQGKSVGLNVIIASLLYRKKPHELKFVMIDPKMVEFSIYAKIEKHYLAKLPGEDKAIITDMTKAVATLNSLVQEMEDRYTLLMNAGCRKFEEYNDKFNAGLLDRNEGHRYMPYIVVIIDEFCDLIMTQGKEVEKPIARLAQKARAVGIHEIIATQRPSTTVITGNIKANFLTRMAFKTSSGIDSKTILDTTGAQQLIGRGDMLINFNSEMTRVQCAFMDTPEVEKLTDYIARQPYGGGAYILPEPIITGEGGEGGDASDGTFEKDPRFYEIGMYVVQSGYASTSNIQRKFSIGYNRAGKIMDQLESIGIVSPSQGGKPRQVLMQTSEAIEILRNFQ